MKLIQSIRPLLVFWLLIFAQLVGLLAQSPRVDTPQKNDPPTSGTNTQAQTGENKNKQVAPPDNETVFRVSTQLVQIDSIVTDKQGNHIEDLSAQDFELTVDGKKQDISYLKFVKLADTSTTLNISEKSKQPPLTLPRTMPTRQLEQKQVRRTIALVVDDLGLSFASTAFAKDALKKFVAEQMHDGDLVGIIRTSGGFGIYQQFTSDKRILNAAIDRLRFSLGGRSAIPMTFGFDSNLMGRNSVFKTDAEKFHDDRKNASQPNADSLADPKETLRREAEYSEKNLKAGDNDANNFRETIFSYGTLGAINQVVRSLRGLPGRKAAIILSDGLEIGTDWRASLIKRQIQDLIELANRSSVAFYTVNVQGLVAPGGNASYESIDASDGGKSFNGFNDELRSLTLGTGGLSFYNNNRTDLLLAKSVDDNKSYYLIGFDPDDDKFDRLRHRIKLSVKRPNLEVRTRNGFLGIEDAAAREIPNTREGQLLKALFSPFGANEIPYQVTSLFYSTTKGEPVIRSYFHIDCSKLKFKDEENGEKGLQLELANFTFDETGAIVERYAQRFQVRLNAEKYQQVLRDGLTYLNDFPIKKSGAYHFRSALRDGESGQLGSSSQFIMIPDLNKDRIALSGIVLSAVAKADDRQNAQILSNPAARRFGNKSELEYQAVIYNPKIDRRLALPQLKLWFELYHDNQLLFRAPSRNVKTNGRQDVRWIDCGGRFQLNTLTAGEYWLRLVVQDELRNGQSAIAEQWIDFTVQ